MAALLQQIGQMMSMWDTVGVGGMDELDRDLQRVDIARAVLALFASGSGAYRGNLQRIFEVIFRVIDRLMEDRLNVCMSKQLEGTSVGAVATTTTADELHTDPYEALRQQRARMDDLVRNAASQREELLKKIAAVEEEKAHVQMLLSHQMNRGQRQADGDVHRMMKKAEAEKLTDELTREVTGLRQEVAELRRQNGSLKELNAKYAAQALELSARLKILCEHNHKLGTSLSLSRHDLIVAERENETAQHELAEAKRSNRLLSDALDSRGSVENRASFVGRGTMGSTPRHLQCAEYVKHVPITKELAAHLVFEILCARKAKGNPLSGFAAAFLTSRYGPDGIAYSYALNLACEMFNADVSLQTFHAAANGIVSDEIYTMIQQDSKTFIDACASADVQLHGTSRLCIPYAHAVGILIRMFPGYSQKTMETLLDALDSALTNTGALYFGTLFPDAARDELVGLGDDGRIAQDSKFSSLFKQYILDDVMMLLNRVEDRICGIGSDIVTAEEMLERVCVMDIIGPKIEIPLQHFFDTAFDPGAQVSLLRAVSSLRSSVLVRTGLTPMERSTHDSFFLRAAEDYKALTGEELINLDYDSLVAQTRRSEFFVGKRGTIDGVLQR